MHAEPQRRVNGMELWLQTVVPPAFATIQEGGSTRSPATTTGCGKLVDSAAARLRLQRVATMSEPDLRLSDVPLIVEGLLLRAMELANSGGPTEAVEAILDHVAALQERRDS